MFMITCVIYISIVTLFDYLISSSYRLQKVLTCLSKHFDIGLVFHLYVMGLGYCCVETLKILFIFQFKVSLSTKHDFGSAPLGKSVTTIKQGGRRTRFSGDDKHCFLFFLERKFSFKCC